MISRIGLLFNNSFSKNYAQNKSALFGFNGSKAIVILVFTVFISIPNFLSGQNTTPPVNPVSNTFTLSASANVSAGVYTTSNTLVRTLWSSVPYQAGTYSIFWDGKDDLGLSMPAGTYTVKVVADNIIYTWEGVIGNNSTNLTGPTVWANYGATLSDMVNVGSYMYCTMWFSEYSNGQMKFNTSTPNQVSMFPYVRIGQGSLFTCANANNVFYGGRSYTWIHNYVFATNVSNDLNATFTSGVVENPAPAVGALYNSVLDLNTLYLPGAISGMAVQQAGNQYLYVAHAAQNVINVYKTSGNTGTFIRSISITAPTNLAFEGDGSLWIAQGTTLTKYTVNSDGTITSTGSTITGFARIAGLDVLSGDLCVLDAGNQQIVKRYNSTTLASTGIIGQLGGYATSPAVANNKFYEEDAYNTFYTFVRHQSDGSIWVCDPGNCRYQHFNSSGTYLNNIMFLQQQYNCNICLNQPTSVFSKYLEYTVDYTKPLSTGWTLTNNWGYGQPAPQDNNLPINGVILMTNSRRYAMFRTAANTYYFGELTTSGIRYITGTTYSNPKLDTAGNLYVNNTGGTYPNRTAVYQKYTLTGFDGSNNPLYSSASTIATVPLGYNSASGNAGSYAVTTSGNIILFNNGNATLGGGIEKQFHLSGFNIANNQMAWKACPETFRSYSGDFPRDGSFDIGNGVSQAGSEANTVGNNIFWGYHGEGWKSSETGIIEHFNDQGLMLGMCGVVGPDIVGQQAPAGYAGNSLNVKPVAIGSNIYIYASDEKQHSGLHRWKVTGLNTIKEQDVTIQLPSPLLTPAAVSPGVNLLAGLPDLDTLTNGTAGWTRDHNEDNTSSSQLFNVNCGYNSYLPSTVDLYVHYKQALGAYTVTRTLGNNIGVNTWNLSGRLSWNRSHQNEFNATAGEYIEILDNNGKIITRLYEDYTPTTPLYTYYVHGNDKILFQNSQSSIAAVTITQSAQPFSISAANGAITFSYAGYSATTSNLIDPTANWKNPTTLRLYFFTNTTAVSGINNDRIVDFPVLTFTVRTDL